MNRSWAWGMWLLWLMCFQFSLLLFYWIQAGTPAAINWGLEQVLLWLMTCGFYLAVCYLRWHALPKIKQQPAKQFRVLVCALILGLLPLLLVHAQMPSETIAGGSGIAVLGVMCLLQLAPSYATPGYEFDSEKNSQ